MKLNIGWKSKLEVFDAVGTIETYSSNRNDVMELLKYINENGTNKDGLLELFGNKEVSIVVLDRVLEYLKDCGYLNNGRLSSKAKVVIENGKVPVEQRGKFRFWNIENLGPMKEMYPYGPKLIIGYKRQNDSSSRYIHRDCITEYKKIKVTMPNSKEEFKICNLSENQYSGGNFACIKQQNQSKDIDLNLELSSSNEINLMIKGNLYDIGDSRLRGENNTVFSDVIVDQELSYYIINILEQCNLGIEYDYKKQIFKLDNVRELIANKVINEGNLDNFEAKFNVTNVSIGDAIYNIEAKGIPIMPGNEIDANYWFSRVIENKVKCRYINDEEFSDLLKETANRIEFEDYIDERKLIKDSYTSKFKRNGNIRSYWNIEASKDLSPKSNNNELVLNRLDLSRGTESSLKSIIDKLVGQSRVEELIFSSKYIINSEQRRKFEVFVEALKLKGCNNIILVTQNKFNLGNIKVNTYDDIYRNRKNWPHDRYFSLKINGVWNYYKMTAELDQCKYDEHDLNKWRPDLVGKWNDISFDKIDRSIFPLELLTLEESI